MIYEMKNENNNTCITIISNINEDNNKSFTIKSENNSDYIFNENELNKIIIIGGKNV